MNEACLYPWDPYSCEWSAEYLWRFMDWIVRLDIMLLGFLLFYVIVIAALGCHRYFWARHQLRLFQHDDRKFQLSPFYFALGLKSLQSIIATAPFLGLIGTCFGILGAFEGGSMQRDALIRMVTVHIAAALVPTASGLMVVIPAIWTYNFLCVLKEKAELQVSRAAYELERRSARPGALSGKEPSLDFSGTCRSWRRLGITRERAELPNFGLMAAPILICSMMGFMIFPSKRPMGLGVSLGPGAPAKGLHVPRIVVKIAPDSQVRAEVNSRTIAIDQLENGLRRELKGQVGSTVCVTADPQVAWSSVAGVIDAAHGVADHVLLPHACP